MRDLLDLILSYYEKLDKAAPVADFDDTIDWGRFRMVNGGLVIDSRDKYEAWYEEINHTMFTRCHSIETLTLSEAGENMFEARMDMHFRADKSEEGQPGTPGMEVRGKIVWKVVRSEPAGDMKLVDYLIEE
jgi:hypothetical protein